MKTRFPLLIFLSLVYCSGFAQNSPGHSDDCAEITLSTDTLKLGILKHDTALLRYVTIKNTGKCPLVIYSITGGVSREFTYKKTFYQPGDTGTLTILVLAAKDGPFLHTICINSSAKTPLKNLTIKGEVTPVPLCAQMAFDKDTLDLGDVPYVLGKHFVINIYNKGKCGLNFSVQQGDEYLNVLNYTTKSISPRDTGKIDIHLGGQVTGNYYGKLTALSLNSKPARKTLFIKARFLPPSKADSTDTEIKLDRDVFDFGKIYDTYPETKTRTLVYKLKVTNTGKKPLVLKQIPSVAEENMPLKPIEPGQSVFIQTLFLCGGIPVDGEPLIIEHNILSGNFKGKKIPIYGMWNYRKKDN